MTKRKPVAELQAGDFIVRVGRHQINATFRERKDFDPTDVGHSLSGPRGGRYVLTFAGASLLVRLVCSTHTPVVEKTATAVIEVDE